MNMLSELTKGSGPSFSKMLGAGFTLSLLAFGGLGDQPAPIPMFVGAGAMAFTAAPSAALTCQEPRICTRCGSAKEVGDFYRKGDRLDTVCKECKKADRNRRYRDQERLRAPVQGKNDDRPATEPHAILAEEKGKVEMRLRPMPSARFDLGFSIICDLVASGILDDVQNGIMKGSEV